jgi:hypothetical protein
MPFYFNRTPHTIRVKLADGQNSGFAPRKDVFVANNLISNEITNLIDTGKLVFRGYRNDELDLMGSVDKVLKIETPIQLEEIKESPSEIEDKIELSVVLPQESSSVRLSNYDKIIESDDNIDNNNLDSDLEDDSE